MRAGEGVITEVSRARLKCACFGTELTDRAASGNGFFIHMPNSQCYLNTLDTYAYVCVRVYVYVYIYVCAHGCIFCVYIYIYIQYIYIRLSFHLAI